MNEEITHKMIEDEVELAFQELRIKFPGYNFRLDSNSVLINRIKSHEQYIDKKCPVEECEHEVWE